MELVRANFKSVPSLFVAAKVQIKIHIYIQ